jgi:16S rRNA (guanine527-N7)-methyltransferase
VIVSRCENIKDRKYDTILSRGVAKVDKMLNYTKKIADKDCVWVLYKGERAQEELDAAKNIIKKMKLEQMNVRYDTPIQRTYTIFSNIADNDRLR